MEEGLVCPSCKFAILPSYFFCPNCGRKFKEPLLSTSVGKQIGVYLLSVFLPPLGLFPGVKYLMQEDAKSKIIGVVVLVLTGVSIGVTVYYTLQLVGEINKVLGQQVSLKDLGY